MSFCPSCKYEYLDKIKICPDCNVKLVDKLDSTVTLSEKDWVVVYTSDAEYEIEMIKDNLESADIEVTVLSQKDRSIPGAGDFSIIKLLVKHEDVDSAVNFINEMNKKS